MLVRFARCSALLIMPPGFCYPSCTLLSSFVPQHSHKCNIAVLTFDDRTGQSQLFGELCICSASLPNLIFMLRWKGHCTFPCSRLITDVSPAGGGSLILRW